jgi:hypothetical protein
VPVSNLVSAATPVTASGWPLLIAPTRPDGVFYLLVSTACGETRCLHLYLARDDDSSTRVTPLRYSSRALPPYGRLARTPQGTVMAMLFVTPQIGYILEGNSEAQHLFVTTNGARSWHQSSIPRDDTIWGLTATSSHLYALFLHCSSATDGCNYMELVHAPLRASYWRGVKIPVGNFYDEPLGAVAGHGEMEMFTELSKEGETIYVSHNGGRSFVSSTHPNLKGSRGCALMAEDVQRVWAVCTSATHESFHLTDDSGSSWSVFVRQPHNVEPTGIFALAGSDFAYVYTGGSRGNIVRMNLGANREHVVGTIGCDSVANMSFVNTSDGYAICNLANGATALVRTKSGGESWNLVSVP